MIVAVPTDKPGGMDAPRSAHFGHCDIFTLVHISDDGQVGEVSILENGRHEVGGCMLPVRLLQHEGVGAIVVGGLGKRPMQGFSEAGIKVFFADPESVSTVSQAMERYIARQLPEMRADQVCQGSGNCQH